MVTENELDEWPEKKLKVDGLFNIRISVLISSSLFGRSRATVILVKSVNVVTKKIITVIVNMTKIASLFGYFKKMRIMKVRKRGIQVVKLVTVVQKRS